MQIREYINIYQVYEKKYSDLTTNKEALRKIMLVLR